MFRHSNDVRALRDLDSRAKIIFSNVSLSNHPTGELPLLAHISRYPAHGSTRQTCHKNCDEWVQIMFQRKPLHAN
jgi:hypothetical protein